MNLTVNYIEEKLDAEGFVITRMNRRIIECIGFHYEMSQSEISAFDTINHSEMSPYLDMFAFQIPELKREYDRDKFSRRIMVQFPKDYHYGRNEDMVPCMESFILFFNKAGVDVSLNLRSSDVTRIHDDISIIIHFVKILLLTFGEKEHISSLSLHVGSFHKYLEK